MREGIINCSVLFVSCDKYTDVVRKNIELFDLHWPNCPLHKYCLAESTCFEGDVISLNCNSDKWTKRLLYAFDNIPTDYVLIILDDLWSEETINGDCILEYLNEMIKDKNIANIGFSHMPGCVAKKRVNNCLIRNRKPWSLVNFQVGLWNIECLKTLLKEKENPWDAEVLGSVRTRLYPKYEFYCLEDDKYTPYKYGKGWLVVRGKWNTPEVNRLQDKLQTKIDLGNRECDDFSGGIKLSFFERVKIHLRVWLYKIKIRTIVIFGGAHK